MILYLKRSTSKPYVGTEYILCMYGFSVLTFFKRLGRHFLDTVNGFVNIDIFSQLKNPLKVLLVSPG